MVIFEGEKCILKKGFCFELSLTLTLGWKQDYYYLPLSFDYRELNIRFK